MNLIEKLFPKKQLNNSDKAFTQWLELVHEDEEIDILQKTTQIDNHKII